jgi:LPXTG-site transpeptidase (sortase) family protein
VTPRTSSVLKWVERLLLVVGLVLGLWSGVTLIEARRYARMPVPPPSISRHLPGEDESPPDTRAAAGQWLARLEAPSVRMTATVLEGTDSRTLRRGAGHIEYTPLPGTSGNVGIAGHRDTTFRPLRDLKEGDPLTLTTTDRVYEYRVSDIRIVDPDDVEVLDPTRDPALTLVTCYPFNFIGNAPKRYIVRAELKDARER